MLIFHAQTLRFFAQHRNVFRVESADVQFRTFLHAGRISRHVLQQNVAVDIGYHHIKRFPSVQQGSISQFYGDIGNAVQGNVVARVVHAPVVNVDGGHLSGSSHAGQDGQDRCAASHVEHRFAFQVSFQQFS